ncbi:glycine/sarcosine/betaine reductase complex component C subunit alpha [Mycoplasmatota bacterium WC44]
MDNIKKLIGHAFLDIANAMETGEFGKVKVGITLLGGELGVDNILKGAEAAANDGVDVVVIGPKVETNLELIEVSDESEAHKKMEELIDSNYIQGAVTMHYNFDIGVSTVGRVITPAFGKEMLIATTTGTSDTDRTVSMFKNAIYGIITAKALGINNPTLGILNVDNARGVERCLKELQSNGYDINFGESGRSDGGSVMRGNDLLQGSVDVLVTDTLTGNILMKMFSSFTTGGSFESTGFGYGPGIGFDNKRIINILSRASGTPVVANAIKYVASLAKGNLNEIVASEYKKVSNAKFFDIIDELKSKQVNTTESFEMPDKEIVTSEISGIDILDLEPAVESLLRSGIYAESGMGCTGPVILISDTNKENSKKILTENKYI